MTIYSLVTLITITLSKYNVQMKTFTNFQYRFWSVLTNVCKHLTNYVNTTKTKTFPLPLKSSFVSLSVRPYSDPDPLTRIKLLYVNTAFLFLEFHINEIIVSGMQCLCLNMLLIIIHLSFTQVAVCNSFLFISENYSHYIFIYICISNHQLIDFNFWCLAIMNNFAMNIS